MGSDGVTVRDTHLALQTVGVFGLGVAGLRSAKASRRIAHREREVECFFSLSGVCFPDRLRFLRESGRGFSSAEMETLLTQTLTMITVLSTWGVVSEKGRFTERPVP